ncbi:methyl-accepting chemotaxis protein [Paraferrimonas sedimenticola]|uniref:Methyl-accepting chemotaxis protein n=1 Tax=Paraferrimonas sedimenticola TaxID=375674 RepID=A0AA37VZ21_9GAMM|nr:methyl-accepting chemotaxis protein [Paraferrimonas sedimenticola]GLP97346.1 methyl-accepting chemotaxis protein [Paraferrimonas sedimenticola]
MAMKVSVAMRAVGGFVLVTLLLLVLGAASLITVDGVKDNSSQLQQVNMPAMKANVSINTLLADQQRVLLTAANSQSSDQLSSLSTRLNNNQGELDSLLVDLGQILSPYQALASELEPVVQNNDTFKGKAQQLVQTRERIIALENQLQAQSVAIETQLEETTDSLLDVLDLEFSDNAAELKLADHAAAIDALLIRLSEAQKALLLQTTVTGTEQIAQELSFLYADFNGRSNMLLQDAEATDWVDASETLVDSVNATLELFQGGSALQPTHKQKVNLLTQADTMMNELESQVAQYTQSLGQLADTLNLATDKIGSNTIDAISSAQTLTTVVMVAAIVVAVVVGYFTVRPIVLNLPKINEAFMVLASGDLSHTLPVKGKDEFAELSANCNQLSGRLKELIMAIQDRAGQLAAAAEQTATVTEQTAKGIQVQKDQMNLAASATQELNASAQTVAANANDALGEIKMADEEAENIARLADENKNTILGLADEVAQASNVINQLHEDSAAIGSILDVIRGIAEQTNLLALNAAIEAARAGEQGRGFAVVADEVRNLAQRTQDSTQEIQQMIEALQQGAQQAVAAMQAGRRQADSCVEKQMESAQALTVLTDAVHQAFESGSQIAHAAKEQHQVSQQIAERLEQIAQISEESSVASEQTNQSSSQVARLAEEMRGSVSEFKAS